MASKGKVYGLILPKKNQEQVKVKPAQSAFNVFGSESDEDEKSNVLVNPFSKNAGPSKIKRQTQVDIDKALLEDPNVYEYDTIYDDMQASKPKVGAKEKEKSNTEKKPRYIAGLLKAAEQKKKEEEKRKERQVQKEREAEGEMYADKEKFVTSAYKQKMLEMQVEEEKDKRMAAFEAMTDVTKQKDMSGFYRYLYRETAGNEITSASGDDKTVIKEDTECSQVKTEPDSSPGRRPQQTSGTSSSSSKSSDDGDSSEAEAAEPKQKAELFKSGRPTTVSNYRKRRVNSYSSSSDSEGHKQRKVKKASHIPRQKSKSKSPPRNKYDRDYSRRKNSPTDVYERGRSVSPVSDRRRIDRSRSKEKLRAYQKSRNNAHRNQRSRSREKSRRSRSREKSRRSRSREQPRRSRSKDKSRRSRSKDKSRRSRSNEQSRRSRSRDKSGKGPNSTSRDKAKKSELTASHSVDRRNDSSSRSLSSEGSLDEGQGLLPKSKGEGRKKSQKTETKEKDKAVEKQHKNRHSSASSQSSGNKENADLTEKSNKTKDSGDLISGTSNVKPVKPISVDPAKKVYPHHNTPKDIEEARKRYLQRKAEREGAV